MVMQCAPVYSLIGLNDYYYLSIDFSFLSGEDVEGKAWQSSCRPF